MQLVLNIADPKRLAQTEPALVLSTLAGILNDVAVEGDGLSWRALMGVALGVLVRRFVTPVSGSSRNGQR